MKRAIVLGGGGPACGLQIGALRAFAEHEIEFDVWSLSCIGAWVGLVYHQFEGTPAERTEQTYHFFRKVFRPDDVHAAFPVNAAFAPDLRKSVTSMLEFVTSLKTYRQLVVPHEIMDFWRETIDMVRDRRRWTEGDFNGWALKLSGAHPLTRFLTSAIYRTSANGLARIYYPDSSFLQAMKFTRLLRTDRPLIYHNAWNLTRRRLEYFTNRIDNYKIIDAQTLCACSALPYVFAPIEMDGEMYCEGAMIRPMDFDPLINHPDLDEVWSLPIVDTAQVRTPEDMTGAMGNLPMMPAGAHGADLAESFRRDMNEKGRSVKIIDVETSNAINYEWSHSNLDHCCHEGYNAAKKAINKYLTELTAAPRPETQPQPGSVAW